MEMLNVHFSSSFGSRSSNGIVVSDNDGDHENEISAVSAKYNLLIGNIKASGRKCLDIENEQLRNDFQVRTSSVQLSFDAGFLLYCNNLPSFATVPKHFIEPIFFTGHIFSSDRFSSSSDRF